MRSTHTLWRSDALFRDWIVVGLGLGYEYTEIDSMSMFN